MVRGASDDKRDDVVCTEGVGPLTCESWVRVVEASGTVNCLPRSKLGCNAVGEGEGWAITATNNQ
jgi:hypothetical protein